jgi:dTDP-4-amino-4,6-dideoxygalactose transaminase
VHSFGRKERKAVDRVLASGRLFRYMQGASESVTFESELADWVGTSHALLLSSGTAGLICALAACGIGPGDEVLVPAYGYVADVLAPLAVGAVPVVCEVDETLTLDVDDMERRRTSRARAVIAVHMNGFPAAMGRITESAARTGMAVIEDACQGLGGTFEGRPLGSIGDIGVFSFNQHKLLTAGEGGAVVTNQRELYERAFITHDGSCGYSPHQLETPVFAGLCFRASEVTAAILRVQLGRADEIVAGLRRVATRMAEALAPVRACEPAPSHDSAGTCGTHLVYQFGDPESAGRFERLAQDCGITARRGAGFGHAFEEWDVLHARRGGHHPDRNPLMSTTARIDADACPRTADLLARSVVLFTSLELGGQTLRLLSDRMKRAFA